MASRDINVVALVKGSERYVFLYDDDSRTETLARLTAMRLIQNSAFLGMTRPSWDKKFAKTSLIQEEKV